MASPATTVSARPARVSSGGRKQVIQPEMLALAEQVPDETWHRMIKVAEIEDRPGVAYACHPRVTRLRPRTAQRPTRRGVFT